jgi:hypothetical protein
MRHWDAFQEDQELVYQQLCQGHMDHVEVVSRVLETQFFQSFLGGGGIEQLTRTFPTPRKKEEVPLWLYLASQLTMRLHGSPGYASLPYVLHCGGLRDALEQGQVERKVDPETNQAYLQFKGYNHKNAYDRRTPCDHDYVRKLARGTDPRSLEHWYGTSVASYFRDQGAYDSEGVFFVDGSYLFVPDNKNYEHSKVGYFDKHNHPISKKKLDELPESKRRRCRWRRYYRMVALSHSNRAQDYLVYAGSRFVLERGEVQALLPLVGEFHEAVGPGVMKILVIDRGFIDGRSFSEIKRRYGVDIVVPLKAGMTITQDAWRLAEVPGSPPWQVFEPKPREKPPEPPQRPEHIRQREEKRQRKVAQNKEDAGVQPRPRLERLEYKLIEGVDLWDECGLPLNVLLLREHMSDGECSEWGLMSTLAVEDPLELRRLYARRPACEEGWRQGKCFWDMTNFRSPKLSLVVAQVTFVLLAYSLLQIFLLQIERGDLAKATRKRLLQQLLPEGEKVAVYWRNYVGYFSVQEYSEILLTLEEGARRRLLGTIRKLRKTQLEPPALPQRPTL